MSVVEFFTQYYDWYFLIGFILFPTALINTFDDYEHGHRSFLSVILSCTVGVFVLWPMAVAFSLYGNN